MTDSLNSVRRPLEAVVYDDGRQVARCLVRRGRYVIGHDRNNEISVDAPSISSQHARLTITSDDEIFLEDMDSANGTLVNGEPVVGMTRLSADSRVILGRTELRFQRAGLPAGVFEALDSGFLRVPRYTLGEAVVQGSTSVIKEARDTTLDRAVAMKVMLPESQRDGAAVLRFVREAQIASQLQHPGVLPIYELGLNEQTQLFYTTRFVEGSSLAELLELLAAGEERAVRRCSLPALLNIWQRICDTIAFAHSRGVVHCGLVPESVTLGVFGEVFVTNWSAALIRPIGEEQTPVVFAPGPPLIANLSPYMPPEQAAGSYEDVDELTDVHALGGLLYKILTLQDPLVGENEDALLEAALNSRVIGPSELSRATPHPHWPGGRLPDFLAAVAMKALRLEREQRHASVIELQREVAAWQDGAATGADLGKLWKQFTGLLGRP
jgi:hypothetical protein